MRHINSVFHDVLKLVPWARFDELVALYGTDELVRKFTTRHQFTALLFGQLGGGSSLREIGEAMTSHGARLYHCGARAPKRSTFADAATRVHVAGLAGVRATFRLEELLPHSFGPGHIRR